MSVERMWDWSKIKFCLHFLMEIKDPVTNQGPSWSIKIFLLAFLEGELDGVELIAQIYDYQCFIDFALFCEFYLQILAVEFSSLTFNNVGVFSWRVEISFSSIDKLTMLSFSSNWVGVCYGMKVPKVSEFDRFFSTTISLQENLFGGSSCMILFSEIGGFGGIEEGERGD